MADQLTYAQKLRVYASIDGTTNLTFTNDQLKRLADIIEHHDNAAILVKAHKQVAEEAITLADKMKATTDRLIFWLVMFGFVIGLTVGVVLG